MAFVFMEQGLWRDVSLLLYHVVSFRCYILYPLQNLVRILTAKSICLRTPLFSATCFHEMKFGCHCLCSLLDARLHEWLALQITSRYGESALTFHVLFRAEKYLSSNHDNIASAAFHQRAHVKSRKRFPRSNTFYRNSAIASMTEIVHVQLLLSR